MIKRNVHLLTKCYRRGVRECESCGETNRRSLTADHIIPLSIGGSNELDNIRVLCRSCHQVITNQYREARLTQITDDGQITTVNSWRGKRAIKRGSKSKYAYRSRGW